MEDAAYLEYLEIEGVVPDEDGARTLLGRLEYNPEVLYETERDDDLCG